MRSSRRQFAGILAGAALAPSQLTRLHADLPAAAPRPLIVSTWAFGKPSNDAALRVIQSGGSLLDAVEQGIWVTELDRSNSSVGLGGLPNADGVVQLDACIMLGPGHRAGSVAALEQIVHPISAARRVLEKTPHVMLVGDGARQFALEQGLQSVPPTTPKRRPPANSKSSADPGNTRQPADRPKGNHDTLALLIVDAQGNIAGGCSTSGWGGKLPGRVGDSPIIGGGLYVDNEVGAAGATGLGENIMRHCGSFQVVELMRQGKHPQEACLEALHRIARRDPKGKDISISFVALDKSGRYGAASSGEGFQYAVTHPEFSRALPAPAITDQSIGPVGGNRK